MIYLSMMFGFKRASHVNWRNECNFECCGEKKPQRIHIFHYTQSSWFCSGHETKRTSSSSNAPSPQNYTFKLMIVYTAKPTNHQTENTCVQNRAPARVYLCLHHSKPADPPPQAGRIILYRWHDGILITIMLHIAFPERQYRKHHTATTAKHRQHRERQIDYAHETPRWQNSPLVHNCHLSFVNCGQPQIAALQRPRD